MDNNTSLKPQEVADMLKITRNMVYRLIRRGELNGYRVGNNVRVDLKDVEEYKNSTKHFKKPISETQEDLPDNSSDPRLSMLYYGNNLLDGKQFVICGQDTILDVLIAFLERRISGFIPQRSYAGSYSGLCALYQGTVQVASTHIWNGEKNEYNIPYIKTLLPGLPTLVITLATRMQGYCVAKGNPKAIKNWDDLKRNDIVIANRQRGSATRILLDEHLRLLSASAAKLQGYRREFPTTLMAACTVAKGGADFSISDERTARQVQNVDFVPLQKERLDLVMREDVSDTSPYHTIIEIIQSSEFKTVIEGIGGYDLSELGKIVKI